MALQPASCQCLKWIPLAVASLGQLSWYWLREGEMVRTRSESLGCLPSSQTLHTTKAPKLGEAGLIPFLGPLHPSVYVLAHRCCSMGELHSLLVFSNLKQILSQLNVWLRIISNDPPASTSEGLECHCRHRPPPLFYTEIGTEPHNPTHAKQALHKPSHSPRPACQLIRTEGPTQCCGPCLKKGQFKKKDWPCCLIHD